VGSRRAAEAKRSTASLDHMKDRSRHLLLAIINGVISFFTLAVLERIQILKLEIRDLTDQGTGGFFYDVFGRPAFWTWPMLVFHVVLFVGAVLIVRRYFLNIVEPGLFFWLALAAIVCVAWLIAALTGTAIGAAIRGQPILERILEAVIYRASQQTALNFVLAVFGVNLVFGAVVQLAANYPWRRQPRYS
jgi:hypothetical protein